MKENSAALSGLIIVNKGEGITSQGVVNRIKRLFGVAKAGHTGTLDPMATGVLPVLVGRGVKASEFMLTGEKHYGATLLLGKTSDTEDVTGNILTECDVNLTEDEVLSAVDSFVGEIMQVPPMYSALKIGGRKLCDIARRGETVAREARPITVYSIKTEKITDKEYYLDIVCSKGTYIRTLCADIGAALGVGGVMKTLTQIRTLRTGTNRMQFQTGHQCADLFTLISGRHPYPQPIRTRQFFAGHFQLTHNQLNSNNHSRSRLYCCRRKQNCCSICV